MVIIDVDPAAKQRVERVRPDATVIDGDASSRLTLARSGLDARSVLIAATSSDAVNREVARVAREHFGVQERVVVAISAPDEGSSDLSLAEFVHAADAVAGQVVNRVSIEASRAVDIGLGVGEILQVTVLEGSPAVGRPLRELSARHWLVAAVYRGGTLIVPHGDTRVAPEDRVLLVGEPSDLQDVAPYFRGGAPVFPSQFGTRVAWAGPDAVQGVARTFAEMVGAEEVVQVPRELRDFASASDVEWRSWLDAQSVGCVVIRDTRLPWFVRLGLVRCRLHAAIVAARRPFLVLRGPPRPLQRLLVCIRDGRAQREVLLAGIDLARLSGASIDVLTVDPSGSGSAGEPLPQDLARLSRIYGIEIASHRVPGNPIARIRAAAEDFDLVVLGIRPEHNTPLAPDISTFLLHDLPVAAVFVPWSPAG